MTSYQITFTTICVILSLPYSLAEYGDDCLSLKGEPGRCVPVKSCRGAYNLLVKANQDGKEQFKDDVNSLRQSRCDAASEIPHICCATDDIQMNPAVFEHLQNLNCGHSGIKRISKGNVADLFSFRWMVLLKYNSNETFACGGSLIDDRHVLTAAHCIHNFQDVPIEVRIGEYDLNSEKDCSKYGTRTKCLDPVEDVVIEKVMVHENYVYKGIHDDIALIRLQRSVNAETKSVNPICLPINANLQKENPEEFMVAGWGRTEFGKRSNKLLWTSVPNQSHDFCKESLGLVLSDQHICAGGRKFHDSCRGDSGGPLFFPSVYEDGVARTIQYGIVSVGARNCGEVSVPAVYISIAHYMQWITDHMTVKGDEY